jgi:tetratricopeptide (TPR) repeat protein
MISLELLAKIKENIINLHDQQIVLRYLLQNILMSELIEKDEIKDHIFSANNNPFLKFNATRLGLYLTGKGINDPTCSLSEIVRLNEDEFFKMGEDVFQRITLQGAYKANIKDAFLLSIFIIKKNSLSSSWSELSKIINLKGDRETKINFWGIVFACLRDLTADIWSILQTILADKPDIDIIDICLQTLFASLLDDAEMVKGAACILENQKLATCNLFIDKLNQMGLSENGKAVASQLLSKIHFANISINEIDDLLAKANWSNMDILANQLQNLGLLFLFAGQDQRAEIFLDRVKTLFSRQNNILNEIIGSLNQNEKITSSDNGETKNVNLPSFEKTNGNEYINTYSKPNLKYEQLEKLIASDHFSQAENPIKKAMIFGKSDPSLLSLSAKLNLKLGGYVEALDEISAACSLAPENHLNNKLLAEIQFVNENYQESFDILFNMYAKQSGDFSNQDIQALCKSALFCGNVEITKPILEKALINNADSPSLLLLASQQAIKLGDIKQARQFLSQVIEIDKAQPEAWITIADIEKTNGEGEKVFEILMTGNKYSPDSQLLLFEMSKSYFKMGNNLKGYQAILETLEKPYETVKLTLDITQFLRSIGKGKQSIQFLNNAINKWPKSPALIFEASRIYNELGHYEKSIQCLEKLDESHQLNQQQLRIYVLSLLNCSEDEFPIGASLTISNEKKVIDLLSSMENESADDVWTKTIKAVVFSLQNNHSKAYDIFRDLLSKPQSLPIDFLWKIQLGLGQVLIELGKGESAIVLFSDVMAHIPDHVAIYQYLANAFLLVGLKDKALETALRTLGLFADDPQVIPWLSKFIHKNGLYELVHPQLQREIKENTKNINQILLGQYLEYLDDRSIDVNALLQKKQEIKFNPCQSILLSELLILSGNLSFAKTSLEAIRNESGQDDRKVNLLIAGLHYSLGQMDEAENILVNLINENEDAIFEKFVLIKMHILENDLVRLKMDLESNFSNPDQIKGNGGWTDTKKNERGEFLPEDWQGLYHRNSDRYLLIACGYNKIGDWMKALEIAEKYLEIDPTAIKVREFASDISQMLLLDEKVKSLASLESNGNERNIETLNILCNNIENALNRGEDIFAATLLNNIISGNEDNLRVQCIQSRILRRQGDVENALMVYKDVKTKITVETIWHMDCVLEFADYDEYLKSVSQTKLFDNPYPYQVLQFMKAKVEIIFLDKQMKEIKSIGLGESNLVSLNLFAEKMHPSIIKFEKDYLEIANWKALGDAISSTDGIIPEMAEESKILHYQAYWYRKMKNLPALEVLLSRHVNDPELNFQAALAKMDEAPQESRRHFQIALINNPQNPLILAAFSYFEINNSNPAEALILIEKALDISPLEKNWLYLAVEAAEMVNDESRSIKFMNKIIELEPTNKPLLDKLIKAYIRKNDISAAVTLIQQFKQAGTESFDELIVQGKFSLINENYSEAARYAKSAMTADPGSSIPFTLLSEMAFQLGQIDKAEEYAKNAIILNKEDLEAYLCLSNVIQFRFGNEKALDYLKSLVGNGHESTKLIIKMTTIIQKTRGNQSALEFLSANITHPEVDLLTQMALIEDELSNDIEAEKYAFESLAMNANQGKLYSLLGQISSSRGDLDLSLTNYSRAIACEPKNVQYYLAASDVHRNRREMLKALEVIRQGIGEIGEDGQLNQKAGQIFWEIKDFTNAEIYFKRAFELDPNNMKIKRQLDTLYAMNIINGKQEAKI